MKIISFSGMDGSGKSTQCGILSERLRREGIDTELIHLLTAGNTVSSNLQTKPLFRTISRELRNLPVNGFGGYVKLGIGLISHLIDAWVTYIRHRLKYKNDIFLLLLD